MGFGGMWKRLKDAAADAGKDMSKGKKAGASKQPCKACEVLQIKAKVPGTKGKRDPSKKRPDNVLTASASDQESLTTNKPVILVRGCLDVELEAVTKPPNKPVKWQVKPNDNTVAKGTPAITPKAGGKKAVLKTDQPGAFSVIATCGTSKKVWNVVFVWVKPNCKLTVRKKRSNLYADNGSTSGRTRFRSGKFQSNKYAWEARCRSVKLIGGGKAKTIGIDRVELHILQNGVGDSLTGNYDGGGTCLEQPKGGLPVVDATSAASPFIVAGSAFKIQPNNTAKKRSIWTGDSPCGSFQKVHKNVAGKQLQSVTGTNDFVTTIASTSKDAPNAITVHAKIDWVADYKGKVDYGSPAGPVGKYKRNGAKTTGKRRYQLVAASTGGQDAYDAGIETQEPRFNGGTDEVWKP